MELTTKSICIPLWSAVSTHAHTYIRIPHTLGLRYSSRWFSLSPSLPSLPLSTVFQYDGCLPPLPCQPWEQSPSRSWLPVFSGSSRVSPAPNLHLAMKMLIVYLWKHFWQELGFFFTWKFFLVVSKRVRLTIIFIPVILFWVCLLIRKDCTLFLSMWKICWG